ncbi:MAG: hypothetical protein IJ304_01170 [Clostridia bacterium]|nr:hypothetical protein [Clostridia bacterium]
MMEPFTIRLAGKTIEVHALFPKTKIFCSEYLADGVADFSVYITPEDIAFEYERAMKQESKESKEPQQYSDTYLETLALYRKIAEKLPEYNTFLIHGSCISVDGEGYLFTATSGTGKSTHTRLWREFFGDRAKMVNDDKPLITVNENGAVIHGTPWNGKHHLGENISVPLKAICVLNRGTENSIEKMDFTDAFPILLGQTYRPKDAKSLAKTLDLLDRLGKNTDVFSLFCNMEKQAASVAYNGMNKK